MEGYDLDLTPVLARASNEDLNPLVEYILNANLTETLSTEDLYKQNQPNHTKYVALIEKEIHSFGGNTFVNIFRGTGPVYAEIVRDVASKLDVKCSKHLSTEEVETALIMQVIGKAWEKMGSEEKRALMKEIGIENVVSLPKSLPIVALQAAIRASGFFYYKLAAIVANAVAKFILGRGLTLAGNATLMRSISLFAGPIGWAITGIWTAVDIAGPAYRVTIPCVLHIAMLRQKQAQAKAENSSHKPEESNMFDNFHKENTNGFIPPHFTMYIEILHFMMTHEEKMVIHGNKKGFFIQTISDELSKPYNEISEILSELVESKCVSYYNGLYTITNEGKNFLKNVGNVSAKLVRSTLPNFLCPF